MFLDFNEGTDCRFVAHFTSVEIDELGEPDTSTKRHVISDTDKGIHDLQMECVEGKTGGEN